MGWLVISFVIGLVGSNTTKVSESRLWLRQKKLQSELSSETKYKFRMFIRLAPTSKQIFNKYHIPLALEGVTLKIKCMLVIQLNVSACKLHWVDLT